MKHRNFNSLKKARALHLTALVTALLAAGSLALIATSAVGCVIPLSLEGEPDSDGGAPPAAPSIISGSPAFTRGVITLRASEKRALSAVLEDVNGDTLSAHLYRYVTDLDPPPLNVNPVITRTVVAPGGAQRYLLNVAETAYCSDVDPGLYDLELYVADQPFATLDNINGRQTTPTTGHKVSAFWRLNCQ
jgi:hypothetical protein